ncbi:MAG: hypothetical protein QOE25_507, partial [Actinomycetota bacterium]|nr:hypothetical protein [Actinomycetota bacterium]
FPTYGWLAFDPTPGRSNPLAAEYAQPAAPTCTAHGCRPNKPIDPGGPGPILDGGHPKGSRNAPLPGSGIGAPAGKPGAWEPYAAGGAVVVGLGLLGLPLWRGAASRGRRRRARGGPRGHILATYRAFTERAASLGYARARGETIKEYRDRVGSLITTAQPPLAELSALADAAAYGPRDPDPAVGHRADEAARRAVRALRQTRTRRQRLFGAYVPARS